MFFRQSDIKYRRSDRVRFRSSSTSFSVPFKEIFYEQNKGRSFKIRLAVSDPRHDPDGGADRFFRMHHGRNAERICQPDRHPRRCERALCPRLVQRDLWSILSQTTKARVSVF